MLKRDIIRVENLDFKLAMLCVVLKHLFPGLLILDYLFVSCDSSNVVCLLEFRVCGVQYVGCACTLFRILAPNLFLSMDPFPVLSCPWTP